MENKKIKNLEFNSEKEWIKKAKLSDKSLFEAAINNDPRSATFIINALGYDDEIAICKKGIIGLSNDSLEVISTVAVAKNGNIYTFDIDEGLYFPEEVLVHHNTLLKKRDVRETYLKKADLEYDGEEKSVSIIFSKEDPYGLSSPFYKITAYDSLDNEIESASELVIVNLKAKADGMIGSLIRDFSESSIHNIENRCFKERLEYIKTTELGRARLLRIREQNKTLSLFND